MKPSILLIIFVLLSLQSYSQEHPVIMADQKIASEKIFKAIGHVELIWKNIRIYADYVEYHNESKTLKAVGRVSISSNDMAISGEELRFNIENMSGEMMDVAGVIQPTVNVKTDQWQQLDKDTQAFAQMEISSCAQCVPIWKISSSNGKLIKEKYFELKNVVFNVKNIPVLYLPYLRYPIKKDGKATGFLFPVIRPVDRIAGPSIKNAFFWNIRENIDLTLGLDTYFDLGLGIGEEFRYLFKSGGGNLKFYYLNYKPDNILKTTNKNDYYLKFSHNSQFEFLNTQIQVNMDQRSSNNIMALLDSSYGRLKQKIINSSVSISSSLPGINFRILGQENKRIAIKDQSETTVTYFPSCSLNIRPQQIWKIPGKFSLSLTYDNQKRTQVGKTLADEDTIFQASEDFSSRTGIGPAYTLDLLNLPWLKTTFQFNSKNVFYNRSLDPVTKEIVDEPLYMSYQIFRLDLEGPTVYKVFNFKKSKLKHIMEPVVSVRYVTDVKNEDRLLKVDRSDLPTYGRISFGIKSNLLLKTSKDIAAQEIFSFALSQDYYFDEVLANPYGTIGGELPLFSELSNRIQLKLSKHLSLSSRLSYNHYTKRFSRINLNVDYNNPDSFLKGAISYSYRKMQHDSAKNPFAFPRLAFVLKFDLPDFPLKLDAEFDYDIERERPRYFCFTGSLDFQCVVLYSDWALRYNPSSGKIEPQFSIGITLGDFDRVKNFMDPQEKF